jgi:hypothetical protein
VCVCACVCVPLAVSSVKYEPYAQDTAVQSSHLTNHNPCFLADHLYSDKRTNLTVVPCGHNEVLLTYKARLLTDVIRRVN